MIVDLFNNSELLNNRIRRLKKSIFGKIIFGGYAIKSTLPKKYLLCIQNKKGYIVKSIKNFLEQG
jgi:hypothetical protein